MRDNKIYLALYKYFCSNTSSKPFVVILVNGITGRATNDSVINGFLTSGTPISLAFLMFAIFHLFHRCLIQEISPITLSGRLS